MVKGEEVFVKKPTRPMTNSPYIGLALSVSVKDIADILNQPEEVGLRGPMSTQILPGNLEKV